MARRFDSSEQTHLDSVSDGLDLPRLRLSYFMPLGGGFRRLGLIRDNLQALRLERAPGGLLDPDEFEARGDFRLPRITHERVRVLRVADAADLRALRQPHQLVNVA